MKKHKTRKVGGGPGLIKAILENDLPTVSSKLSRRVGKSNVDSVDDNGNTALMISYQKGFYDIFLKILEFSPDPFLKNKAGISVFNTLTSSAPTSSTSATAPTSSTATSATASAPTSATTTAPTSATVTSAPTSATVTSAPSSASSATVTSATVTTASTVTTAPASAAEVENIHVTTNAQTESFIDAIGAYIIEKNIIKEAMAFLQEIPIDASVILFFKKMCELDIFEFDLTLRIHYKVKVNDTSCLSRMLCTIKEEERNSRIPMVEWVQSNEELKNLLYNYGIRNNIFNVACSLIGENEEIVKERINRDFFSAINSELDYPSKNCLFVLGIKYNIENIIGPLLESSQTVSEGNVTNLLYLRYLETKILPIVNYDFQEIFFDYSLTNIREFKSLLYITEQIPPEVVRRRIQKILEKPSINYRIIEQLLIIIIKSKDISYLPIFNSLLTIRKKELEEGRINLEQIRVLYNYLNTIIITLPIEFKIPLINMLIDEYKYPKIRENDYTTRLFVTLIDPSNDKELNITIFNAVFTKKDTLFAQHNIFEKIKQTESLSYLLDSITPDMYVLLISFAVENKNVSLMDMILQSKVDVDTVFKAVTIKKNILSEYGDVIGNGYIILKTSGQIMYNIFMFFATKNRPELITKIYNEMEIYLKKEQLEYFIKRKDEILYIPLIESFSNYSTFLSENYQTQAIIFNYLLTKEDISSSLIFINKKFQQDLNTERFMQILSSPKLNTQIKNQLLIIIMRDGLYYLFKPLLDTNIEGSVLLNAVDSTSDKQLVKLILDYFDEKNLKEEFIFLIKKIPLVLKEYNSEELEKRFMKILTPELSEQLKKELTTIILNEKIYGLIKPILNITSNYTDIVNLINDKTDIEFVKPVFEYLNEKKLKDEVSVLIQKYPLVLNFFIVSELTQRNLENIKPVYEEYIKFINKSSHPVFNSCLPGFIAIFKIYMEEKQKSENLLDYENELILLCKDVVEIPGLLEYNHTLKRKYIIQFLMIMIESIVYSKNPPELNLTNLNDLFLLRCLIINDTSNWTERFLNNPKIFIDYQCEYSGGNAFTMALLAFNINSELRINIMKKLVAKRININIYDKEGESLVSLVLKFNNFKENKTGPVKQWCSDNMVRYIVTLPGICLTIKNKDGTIPEAFASRLWTNEMYGKVKAIDVDTIVWNGLTRTWIKSLVDKHYNPENGEFNDPNNQIYCISCLVFVGNRPSACDHVSGHYCNEYNQRAKNQYALVGGIPPGYNQANLFEGAFECCAHCNERSKNQYCRYGCIINGVHTYQCNCPLHLAAQASKYYRLFKIIEKFAELQRSLKGTNRTFKSVWEEVTNFARVFPFDSDNSMKFKNDVLKTRQFLPDELLNEFPDVPETALYPSGIKATSVPNIRKPRDPLTNGLYISLDILTEPKENIQTMDESTIFLKFKHREISPEYPIKEHGDISLENLQNYLKSNNVRCPSYGFNATTDPHLHCNAYLYPDELKNLVMQEKLTNEEYANYRDKFMKASVEIPADGVSNTYFVSPSFDDSDKPAQLESGCRGGATTASQGGKRMKKYTRGKVYKPRKTRKRRNKKPSRKMRGGGVNCYGNNKTWSCSAQCGESGACEPYD
jgi:hypothetical protein